MSREDRSEANDAAGALTEADYGEVVEIKIHLVKASIGSSSEDRGGTEKYTAPSGFVVLDHQLIHTGHHSGISHVETIQPGRLSYESSAFLSLKEALRQGFAEGTLVAEGTSSAEGAAGFGKFLKRFDARYRFVADTHGSVSFRWYLDSETFSHGARIDASAVIRLQKAATDADAERAADIIRYAIEQKEQQDVFELMDGALGIHPSDLGESEDSEDPSTK